MEQPTPSFQAHVFFSFNFLQRLNGEFQQKVVVLETDLSESLDELSDALEREKDYEISLNNARRRERALMTKLRRYEETMREQDEEIKYLVETKSTLDLSYGNPVDASTQTEKPGYYEERGVDIGLSKGHQIRNSTRSLQKNTDVRSSSRSHTSVDRTDAGKQTEKQPPEGLDLLSGHETISRKEEILGEARRRRTLKSKKEKNRKKSQNEMPEADQTQKITKTKKKKSLFEKLLCCGSSNSKAIETDMYDRRV